MAIAQWVKMRRVNSKIRRWVGSTRKYNVVANGTDRWDPGDEGDWRPLDMASNGQSRQSHTPQFEQGK